MDSFAEFVRRLWLSALPLKLVYAICTAAVFEVLVWLVANRLHAALRPALQRDRTAEPSVRAVRMKLLLRPPKLLVRSVLYVLAVAIILRIFGFPLRLEVLPILAVVAAGALLACWRLLQDCVRGYLLAYQNVFSLGDEISLGDVRGTVSAMSLPNTVLRTADGAEVTIANGAITQVTNHSRHARPSEQPREAEDTG